MLVAQLQVIAPLGAPPDEKGGAGYLHDASAAVGLDDFKHSFGNDFAVRHDFQEFRRFKSYHAAQRGGSLRYEASEAVPGNHSRLFWRLTEGPGMK